MKTLAIIPARKGSKRLPGKNLLPLCGKPLITWAIEATLAARGFARILVSSDDIDVLRIADGYPSIEALRRPDELCTDSSLAYEYVLHAVDWLARHGDTDYDAVAIIQATSPLILPEDIEASVDKLEKTGADTVVSVCKIDFAVHPYKMKSLCGDRLHDYIANERGVTAYHQLPELYVRNGAIYVSRARVFLQHRVIGCDCRAHVMPRERSIDINDKLDYDFARFLSEASMGFRALS